MYKRRLDVIEEILRIFDITMVEFQEEIERFHLPPTPNFRRLQDPKNYYRIIF